MDTGLLYLALAEKELSDCMRSEKRRVWELLRSNDCKDSFAAADACNNFYPWTCCGKHKKTR